MGGLASHGQDIAEVVKGLASHGQEIAEVRLEIVSCQKRSDSHAQTLFQELRDDFRKCGEDLASRVDGLVTAVSQIEVIRDQMCAENAQRQGEIAAELREVEHRFGNAQQQLLAKAEAQRALDMNV